MIKDGHSLTELVLMLGLEATQVCPPTLLIWEYVDNALAGFGGYGFTSRKWGLLLDNILSINVVLADGTITNVSQTTNPDLFWVCSTPQKTHQTQGAHNLVIGFAWLLRIIWNCHSYSSEDLPGAPIRYYL